MTTNNNDHISDDFLKGLLQQTPDEPLSADFTDKVMSLLPKTEAPAEVIEKDAPVWWQWVLYAAALAGAAYFVFFVNLPAHISDSGAHPLAYLNTYLNMFSSLINFFTRGMSDVEVTTRPLMIILALALLIAGDRILKKKLINNTVIA